MFLFFCRLIKESEVIPELVSCLGEYYLTNNSPDLKVVDLFDDRLSALAILKACRDFSYSKICAKVLLEGIYSNIFLYFKQSVHFLCHAFK